MPSVARSDERLVAHAVRATLKSAPGRRRAFLAINTSYDSSCTAWVTIDDALHRAGDSHRCVYSADPAGVGRTVAVDDRNGKSVHLTVPAAGFVVYE